MLRRFLLSAVLILSAASAHAQSQPSLPKPLADHKARGAQVYYLGKYDLLDGWVMIRSGQPEFYYATPGSNALVMGLLFNGNGDLLTTEQLGRLPLTQEGGVVDMMASQIKPIMPGTTMESVPAPAVTPPGDALTTATNPTPPMTPVSPSLTTPAVTAPVATSEVANQLVPNTPANQLFSSVETAARSTFGDPAKPAFYAFVDPNCSHCQRFIREVEPFVRAGAVSVHFLPVGFDDKSKKQAAFVLSAGDGPERFVAYAKGQTSQLPAPNDISVDAVDANLLLMGKWNLDVTPIIVYRAGKDQSVKLIKGRPTDIQGAVNDLTGK